MNHVYYFIGNNIITNSNSNTWGEQGEFWVIQTQRNKIFGQIVQVRKTSGRESRIALQGGQTGRYRCKCRATGAFLIASGLGLAGHYVRIRWRHGRPGRKESGGLSGAGPLKGVDAGNYASRERTDGTSCQAVCK